MSATAQLPPVCRYTVRDERGEAQRVRARTRASAVAVAAIIRASRDPAFAAACIDALPMWAARLEGIDR